MKFNKIRSLSIIKQNPVKYRYFLQALHTMTKGKAKATVSGRTIAETDEYEVVEGNIYVS